ncbi:MAG: branched-chain-amino-acid transaminase [Candidatus Thermoplasmatota archaeon]|nr:branched-chain-amino-acid transaminase [Candidatus Thermoplasmatota archaeon]
MVSQVYIDGSYYARSRAKISVYDHGLLYGDGIFEGIRIYDGNIFKLDKHLERLYESAKTITLNIPLSFKELRDACIDAVRTNKLRDGYIRLMVTRGIGDLGLDPRKCPKATVIIIVDKISLFPAEFYEKGLEVATVPTTRNMADALCPKVKSLNYLNNVLAKIEANNIGVPEGIMLNSLGFVTEGTGDNIFSVKNSTLRTPPTFDGALAGITRNTVIEIADRFGYTCEKKTLTRHDLYNSDECFLTGTAAELIPVIRIDGRTIGKGEPGEIFIKLLEEFRKITRTDGVRVFP